MELGLWQWALVALVVVILAVFLGIMLVDAVRMTEDAITMIKEISKEKRT